MLSFSRIKLCFLKNCKTSRFQRSKFNSIHQKTTTAKPLIKLRTKNGLMLLLKSLKYFWINYVFNIIWLSQGIVLRYWTIKKRKLLLFYINKLFLCKNAVQIEKQEKIKNFRLSNYLILLWGERPRRGDGDLDLRELKILFELKF